MLGESVNRILTSKFRMDLFDDPYVDTNYADQFTGNAKMRAIALKAARQSIVLLKMKEISCLWINQKLKNGNYWTQWQQMPFGWVYGYNLADITPLYSFGHG